MCVYRPDVKFPNNTYYDYFVFNGIRYPIGTAVNLKEPFNSKRLAIKNKQTVVLEHSSCNDKDHYLVFSNYTNQGEIYCMEINASPEKWIDKIIPKEEQNIFLTTKPVEYYKDSEDGDVMFGWVIYIIIMLGLFIFKDRVVGWFFASLIFFSWRKVKLRKGRA